MKKALLITLMLFCGLSANASIWNNILSSTVQPNPYAYYNPTYAVQSPNQYTTDQTNTNQYTTVQYPNNYQYPYGYNGYNYHRNLYMPYNQYTGGIVPSPIIYNNGVQNPMARNIGQSVIYSLMNR